MARSNVLENPVVVFFPDGGAAYRFTTAGGAAGEWLRPPAGMVKVEIRAVLPSAKRAATPWPLTNAAVIPPPPPPRRRSWWRY